MLAPKPPQLEATLMTARVLRLIQFGPISSTMAQNVFERGVRWRKAHSFQVVINGSPCPDNARSHARIGALRPIPGAARSAAAGSVLRTTPMPSLARLLSRA